MPSTSLEINASAGRVGDSHTFTLNGTNREVRVNAGLSRTATFTNVSGGTLTQSTIDNAGSRGAFSDVAAGSSQTVVSADGARLFALKSGDSVTCRVVIS